MKNEKSNHNLHDPATIGLLLCKLNFIMQQQIYLDYNKDYLIGNINGK